MIAGAFPDWIRPPRWFKAGLLGTFATGLLVRVLVVVFHDISDKPGLFTNYDPIFYHKWANLVANGRGYLAPYLLTANLHGRASPSANHGPALSTLLALFSWLGLDSFTDHRVITAVVGALAVPVIGYLVYWLMGPRAGLIAAGLAAVYPSLWLNDGMLMPESLYAVVVAGILFAMYAILAGRHRTGWSVGLGALIGLAMLTRGEAVLFVPILVLPLLVALRKELFTRRLAVVALALLSTVVLLLPWTIYNLNRFERPVYLSTSLDTTLDGANCDTTYYGKGIGYWSEACFANIANRHLEESVASQLERKQALRYISTHKQKLPVVALARFGRVWYLFKPGDSVTLDALQSRPQFWSWAGMGMFFAMIPFALIGVFALRRRRVPVWPLGSMFLMVSVAVVVFYGNTRFRVPADIALVALAACGLESILPGARNRPRADEADAEPTDSVVEDAVT
ncbi:MAG: glycosyl transferase, family 39 [Actinomycetia bacterium]|nr:glycosyl transferase, family 39 [Actinomycetes bacterium]